MLVAVPVPGTVAVTIGRSGRRRRRVVELDVDEVDVVGDVVELDVVEVDVVELDVVELDVAGDVVELDVVGDVVTLRGPRGGSADSTVRRAQAMCGRGS